MATENTPSDSPYMTVKECAEYLRTTPKGIYQRVDRGWLPVKRCGSRLLFDRRTVDLALRQPGPKRGRKAA
jgi:excisionase family DNA binding protein